MVLIALQLAMAMPSHIDLEDVGYWEDASESLLDGPPGCWEMVGKASWDWDFGRFGGNRGDAVMAGRLNDSEWSELYLHSLGEVKRESGQIDQVPAYAKVQRFAPMIGKTHGELVELTDRPERRMRRDRESRGPSNPLRGALSSLGGDAIASWVTWNEEYQSVVLHRTVPIGDGGKWDAELLYWFPEGTSLPTALDVLFPESFLFGSFPKKRIENARVRVRGQGTDGRVFPTSEAMSFDFSVLGLQFRGAQSIRYTSAVGCPLPPGYTLLD